jgi:hypothetical protein
MTKRYNFCLVLLSLLLSLLAAQKLNAQQIDMSGTVGYDRYGGTVTLSASRIENYGAIGSSSGTLVLQLWATSMPYYGQSILNGYKLAEANLGILWGGYYLSNINRSVLFYEPPIGYYNMVLVVAEWDGSKYLTVDWCNFTDVESFGGLPPFSPTPQPQPLDLIDEYVGTWEGTQNFAFNGTSYDMTSTSIISRYGNMGFYSKTYVRTPGQLVAEGETWQYDNGTMYGIVKSEGVVVGTITGTWSVSGRAIISNISAVAGDLAYTQYVNNSFPDSETMLTNTTTSYGAYGSGTSKKILAVPSPSPNVAPPPAPSGGGGGGGSPAPSGGGQSQASKKGGKSPSAKKSSGGSSKKSSASKSSSVKKSGSKKKFKK